MGERWEYLCFSVECKKIKEIEGGDRCTRDALVGTMNFGVLRKLGDLGWKMCGNPDCYDPFIIGLTNYVFVREKK